ncbi:MAG: 50S ribosomal protein L23 [Candidatus Micrarchaeia archaeon]
MSILKHPVSTEKAIGMIDKDNVITYIVDFRASKNEIRKEFERLFGVKVSTINAANTQKNTKKVFIKLAPGYKASDVAIKLKLV